jgi:hypothetical protein
MDFLTLPIIVAALTGDAVEEPSEPAMRAAFEARVSSQVQGAMDFVNETGGPEAVAKIRAAGTDKFEVRSFQKLNCARSGTKPGYVCGFMVDLEVVNGELQTVLVGRFFAGTNGLDLDLGS